VHLKVRKEEKILATPMT